MRLASSNMANSEPLELFRYLLPKGLVLRYFNLAVFDHLQSHSRQHRLLHQIVVVLGRPGRGLSPLAFFKNVTIHERREQAPRLVGEVAPVITSVRVMIQTSL